MNLRWNTEKSRFEAEFQDFQGDLAAVKAAGFKTDGPPGWVWYATKPSTLNKLKENRPASGLTITAEARARYQTLNEIEEKNLEVKKQADAARKALKKKLHEDQQDADAYKIPGKGYIEASDLPPAGKLCTPFVPPPPPEIKCFICNDPVYFYELQDPPTCMDCEKKVLDKKDEVC